MTALAWRRARCSALRHVRLRLLGLEPEAVLDGWMGGWSFSSLLCYAPFLASLGFVGMASHLICRNILALKPNCRLPTTAAMADVAARLGVLEGNMDRLWGRVKRVEDRVDRLYAQGKVFTINASGLDQVWGDVGDAATAGALADRGGGTG